MSEQQSVEQRVISDLFSRIQQAEAGSGPRDAEAERLIQECIAKQPAAPITWLRQCWYKKRRLSA